jgi:hypothetical protein
MMLRNIPRRALLSLAGVALFAGCDTNNSGGVLANLAGSYAFAELRFVPTASAIQPADVIARLDTADTRLEVASDGDSFFFFEEPDNTRSIVRASTSATSTSVTFRATTTSDVQNLVRYLLPSTLRLTHDGGVTVMNGTIPIRANLQVFDPQAYQGLIDVPGTLFVRLERR